MSVTAPDGSVWPAGSLRAIEHTSIREFVQKAANDGYLSGRVLDYGCGFAPYREIVEGVGGEWIGYDRADFPDNHVGNVGPENPFWHRQFGETGRGRIRQDYYDVCLCTQVLQYKAHRYVEGFFLALKHNCKSLVMTYPTTWPEAQPEDLYRFTKAGMERLLTEAGFEIIYHESRASVTCLGEKFSLGGGVIARA